MGGAVRDALLHRLNERPDLDLVVPSDALDLCRTLAASCGGSSVVLDAERDMARLVLNGWTIDFARREGQSLDDDLRRRDYTINAIALPLGPHGALVDPTGGVNDLQNRRLRAVCESNLTNDPLRLLRGVRLMAELPLNWTHKPSPGFNATGNGSRTQPPSASWLSFSGSWQPHVPTWLYRP